MSSSDTTVPTAPRDGKYFCTGGRQVRFFVAGEALRHGPDCGENSLWLFSANHNQLRDELIRVSIDLDSIPHGTYLWIDDLIDAEDTINLVIDADYGMAGLADGAYRIISCEDEGDSFHLRAEKIGHKYWDSDAPLYHTSMHP